MWHTGVRWHHVESDILKEGPGTETSWRWGIVEHQIPSIKVLSKTNAKSHKHPGIKLLFIIKLQDTIGKPKKTELI